MFFGEGLSESDYSDYMVAATNEEIAESKELFESLLLLGFLIKTKKLDYKLFDTSNSEYWEFTQEHIDELTKTPNKLLIQETPNFSYALKNANMVSIGNIQEIPELVFLSLKDMFSANFILTRESDGYTYN